MQETRGIECFVLQPVTKLRTEDSCRGESYGQWTLLHGRLQLQVAGPSN